MFSWLVLHYLYTYYLHFLKSNEQNVISEQVNLLMQFSWYRLLNSSFQKHLVTFITTCTWLLLSVQVNLCNNDY